MWDGNNYVRINGTDGSNVEREPMWDGNTAAQIYDRVLEGLSENQCGMETGFHIRLKHHVPLSENQCGMETIRCWVNHI